MNIPVTPFENYVRLFYSSKNEIWASEKQKNK